MNDSDKGSVRVDSETRLPVEVRSTPSHPVAAAVAKYVHRIRDSRQAARIFAPAAASSQISQLEASEVEMKELVTATGSTDPQIRSAAVAGLLAANRKLDRLLNSSPTKVVLRSLFLGMFSAFDAFTGELLQALFSCKPALYGALHRELSFLDILSAPDIDAVKAQVLADEIETIRRKSYAEQFADLGKRFEIELTSFPAWRRFVECAQRRNLLTHCDGVVSQQYIDQCKVVGYAVSDLPKVGEEAKLPAAYFFESCELLIEVGVKLGHTLWRKLLPDQLDGADQALNELLYDALAIENWKRARIIGEFAHNQRRFSSELSRRQIAINYAQALKWGGLDSDASKVIDSFDWSASSIDFRLAVDVLRDELDAAAEKMRQMGRQGELIKESAYYTWPLFRVFNGTLQFERAFEDVYGYSFVRKVNESASAAVAQADQVRTQSVSQESSGDVAAVTHEQIETLDTAVDVGASDGNGTAA